MVIKLETFENGLIQSKFEDDSVLDKAGLGSTIEDSLQDLVFHLKSKALETEEEKSKLFLDERRPIAFELFKGLYMVMKDKWFTLYDLENKLNEPKDAILVKLKFLSQFGYLKSDRPSGPGLRMRLLSSVEERIAMFDERIKNFENEIKALKYNIEIEEKVKEQLSEELVKDVRT